ncbi:MAG: D-alanine--D-alanine ligase [Bacteroidia bacterium]
MKIKIGIIFGGTSREREISFAGGRTVYDNLNKALFEPVPLFVDSFGNIILLDWAYIYKGSIRDFYPSAEHIPNSENEFQYYAEQTGPLSREEQLDLVKPLGRVVEFSELCGLIDFAFLCLHGSDGEDGRIQGMLEYLRIPYSGSGILSSAIGMNKAVQKEWMRKAGFKIPKYSRLSRTQWNSVSDHAGLFNQLKTDVGLPFVVKSANQGSSIGVSVVNTDDVNSFITAVNKSFFRFEIKRDDWKNKNAEEQVEFIRRLTDIREGIGMPLLWDEKMFYSPDELLDAVRNYFNTNDKTITLEAADGESEILIEEFLTGKEFSCIVIENTDGIPVALPPTEIRKGKEVFDYRSKYLPGLSRKITPIDLPATQLAEITDQCEKLFTAFHFNVYARIDGFITEGGKIFLNDPNTTSGMLPSSFFFHQAAEIGLNPSQFLTYIIRTSVASRESDFKNITSLPKLLQSLDKAIEADRKHDKEKIKVAVMLGGYSSERHISVESGRNIYEKLASSVKYEPLPVFVSGSNAQHFLHTIPVNILLKDNADDIKEKVEHWKVHPLINEIVEKCKGITQKYSSLQNLAAPQLITYDDLSKMVQFVFIALHGRPGEDGVSQQQLERVGLPYNGSGVASSQTTIDKYKTTEILMHSGLHAAKHKLVYKKEWLSDAATFYKNIISEFKFPFIAKPVDDGCSSAVKMIRSEDDLNAFCQLIFRSTESFDEAIAAKLKIKPKEELSQKEVILIEELIAKKNADRFLEITGGMLTHVDENGNVQYELFEASEALSEGDVLSLEEKFLAGQGQNITPARYYPKDKKINQRISDKVKVELERAARLLKVEGYCRIDAFVRIFNTDDVEVLFIEVNSLPGMTPATCIFHQAAINNYKPYEFIDKIIEFGFKKQRMLVE